MAAAKIWSFTTGAAPDLTPPTVISTVPADLATGVDYSASISAHFSKTMDSSTITTASFTIKQGLTAIPGVVSTSGSTATFNPTANLSANTLYTVTVTTAVQDLVGNAMAANKTWSFTTGSARALVNLGSSINYVVLAESAISTVPSSAIIGDIGISPAAESYITGFSQTNATGFATSPQVTGKIFAADMAPPTPGNLTTAVGDMVPGLHGRRRTTAARLHRVFRRQHRWQNASSRALQVDRFGDRSDRRDDLWQRDRCLDLPDRWQSQRQPVGCLFSDRRRSGQEHLLAGCGEREPGS